MPIACNLYRHSPSLKGRSPTPSPWRAKPGKQEGLLISPTSGRASQITVQLSWTHFWLCVGIMLSAVNLVIALISLILF